MQSAATVILSPAVHGNAWGPVSTALTQGLSGEASATEKRVRSLL